MAFSLGFRRFLFSFGLSWPHLRSGIRQINQLDGIEYVAAGAARELALKNPECRDGQHCGERKHAGNPTQITDPSMTA